MKRLVLAALIVVGAQAAQATPVYVQLDPTNTIVVGEFARPQNVPTPPGYAVIDSSDSRYAAWQAQEAGQASCAAAEQAGVTFTNASGSLPEAVGTWSVAPSTTDKVQGVASYIQANGKFPAALPQMPWRDLGGTAHLFTSTAHFTAWASALGDYATALDLACDAVQAGGSWSAPANPVAIP